MRKAIGIDIGGTNIRAALVSQDGVIEAHRAAPTPSASPDVVARIDAMIAELDADAVAAIGVGVPGRVDTARGEAFAGGFVDLSGEPLARRLRSASGRPVFVDNDGSMALVAEARFGAARGLSHAVMLTIGTGIGGAILADGVIFHGRATAGQLGHLTVDMNGASCACGRKGCIETTSSGTALRRHLAAAGLSPSTLVEELLQANDAASRAVLEAWARPLRFCIDSLVAAFNPERIILGGGLGRAACEALVGFPAGAPWFQCDVTAALLGDSAGVIGAACAAVEFAGSRA